MPSGYGSQALALKYLGIPFEHWKICEWAVKSIQAYKDIHFTDDNFDYSQPFDIDTLKKFLLNKGISSNYNEPMTMQQINRLNEKQIRNIYNNIVSTNNLVNIQQVKGKDLDIIREDIYDYILTYSFPCQDLSLAGKGKGMSDTSTRSGMLWEVERILTECYELGTMPQILLMENVPQVHGTDNIKDFNKWQLRLEELGYKNYMQDLIATDYGIPQTRNRCFMVSILGDYSYTFPKPIPLKLKLKNMLEDNVDEKYYLSDKMKQYIFSEDDKYKVNKNSLKLNRDIACSKTTREGWTRADTSDYITENINVVGHIPQWHQRGYIYDEENSMTTICATDYKTPKLVKIKNATKQGYLEATDGDGIDISSRMEHHRGNVQKDKIQTITTSGGNDRGVVIGTYQYSKSDKFMQGKDRLQLSKETSDTLQTTPKEGIVINPLKNKSGKSWQFEQQVYDENGSARTLKASEGSGNIPKVVNNDLRIRKLTPKECFRLMGVKDEDFDKVKANQSDSSLYHLAGDSIVINVLMGIFGELL